VLRWSRLSPKTRRELRTLPVLLLLGPALWFVYTHEQAAHEAYYATYGSGVEMRQAAMIYVAWSLMLTATAWLLGVACIVAGYGGLREVGKVGRFAIAIFSAFAVGLSCVRVFWYVQFHQ
jgi:hypothetical protein